MSKETLRYGEESGTQLQFHTGTAAGTQKRPAGMYILLNGALPSYAVLFTLSLHNQLGTQ